MRSHLKKLASFFVGLVAVAFDFSLISSAGLTSWSIHIAMNASSFFYIATLLAFMSSLVSTELFAPNAGERIRHRL